MCYSCFNPIKTSHTPKNQEHEEAMAMRHNAIIQHSMLDLL